jgi:hypothetical protein
MQPEKDCNPTELNCKRLDHQLQFGLLGMEKPLVTEPIKTRCNRFETATGTPRKYALFAPILKKNGAELNVLWPK